MNAIFQLWANSRELTKRFSQGLAAAVALLLLAGTSPAQATEVFVEGDTVVRIENLTVLDSDERGTVYDVLFQSVTGYQAYGPELSEFTFTTEDELFLRWPR